ncbi:MAG: HEPN domain-containing protein [Cyclobacteriaceae bacterium]|nr:HEPN domain-containing protein [Cyclobacteriaceae bacterium]
MNKFTPEDYINYRLQRARETLDEIKILIDNKLWNTAINRMYYACFYAVGALLVKHGIETSSHSGSRQKFGQLFIHTGLISKDLGKHYSELFEKRQKGDYNDFFDFDEETVMRLYPTSMDLVKEINKMVKG